MNMNSSIEELKTEYTMSTSFVWKFTESNPAWPRESPSFILNMETPSECYLKLDFVNGEMLESLNARIIFAEKLKESMKNETIFLYIENIKTCEEYMFKLRHSEIFDRENVNTFSFSLELQPYCSVIVNDSDDLQYFVRISYKKLHAEKTILSQDLGLLLDKEMHSDLIMIVGKERLNVHKCILSSRSDVLAKMLQADMVEKNNGVINMQNWNPNVVNELLLYIYTGSCCVSRNSCELFKIAHFFEISELQKMCRLFLMNSITINNIVDILVLVDLDQYNLNDLKVIAQRFVKNNEKELIKNKKFLKYLYTSISLNNISLLLHIAHLHNLNELMGNAIKFIKQNYKNVIKIEECKAFLLENPELTLKILEFSLEECNRT